MHLQPFYKDCTYLKKDNMDISQSLFKKGLCLPSGSSLTKDQLDYIVGIVLKTVKANFLFKIIFFALKIIHI